MSALRREVEVVPALRHLLEESCPLAAMDLFRLERSLEIGECLACGHVGKVKGPGLPMFPAAAACWLWKLRKSLALGHSDHKKAWTKLRHAVVGSVQHRAIQMRSPPHRSFAEKSLEHGPARLVVVRECVDVLKDERSWSRFGEDPCVCLQETHVAIETRPFPFQPEP